MPGVAGAVSVHVGAELRGAADRRRLHRLPGVHAEREGVRRVGRSVMVRA